MNKYFINSLEKYILWEKENLRNIFYLFSVINKKTKYDMTLHIIVFLNNNEWYATKKKCGKSCLYDIRYVLGIGDRKFYFNFQFENI